VAGAPSTHHVLCCDGGALQWGEWGVGGVVVVGRVGGGVVGSGDGCHCGGVGG